MPGYVGPRYGSAYEQVVAQTTDYPAGSQASAASTFTYADIEVGAQTFTGSTTITAVYLHNLTGAAIVNASATVTTLATLHLDEPSGSGTVTNAYSLVCDGGIAIASGKAFDLDGPGGDSKISHDGTDVVATFAGVWKFTDSGGGDFISIGYVAGTGNVEYQIAQGSTTTNLRLNFAHTRFYDNKKISLGTGTGTSAPDAAIYHNGTNLRIETALIAGGLPTSDPADGKGTLWSNSGVVTVGT